MSRGTAARGIGTGLLLLLAFTSGCPREAPPDVGSRTARSAPTAAESASTGTSLAPSVATPAVAHSEIRYLALGDSFTIGTGSQPEEAFPSRLATRWREQGLHVTLKNLAVNGYTTTDVLEKETPEIAPFAPTMVTLAVGANDRVHGSTPEHYRSQVRKLFAAILAAGVAPDRIVTLPQPDWSRSPAARAFGDPRSLAASIDTYNTVLRDEAAATGARYVDLFPLMRRQAEEGLLAADGLHPSARAHDQWAAELAPKLLPLCTPPH